MSTFVLIDCCDYMVLDFRQQLKNALKDVKCLGDLNGSGAGWGGGGGVYTPLLLELNIGSLKKNIILPCFYDHFQHLL